MSARDLPYAIAYAIEDTHGSVHLVDTGVDNDENWVLLVSALSTIGKSVGDIATVTATHLHHDHAGMADRIRAASGASVLMHRADVEAMAAGRTLGGADSETVFVRWGVPQESRAEMAEWADRPAASRPVSVDQLLDGDELLDVAGRQLRVLHTPGHTRGHLVIREEIEGVQFTGDHLLPMMYPGIGLGGTLANDDPVGDYQRSLALTAAHPDDEACPGHGYRFDAIADRCSVTSAHHARRTTEVAALTEARPDATVWQIAAELTWTAGWANLSGVYRYSALAQTALHIAHVGAQS